MPYMKHNFQADTKNSTKNTVVCNFEDDITEISKIFGLEEAGRSSIFQKFPHTQGPYYCRQYYYLHHHPHCNHQADLIKHYMHTQRDRTDNKETDTNKSDIYQESTTANESLKHQGDRRKRNRSIICEEITKDFIKLISSTEEDSPHYQSARSNLCMSNHSTAGIDKATYSQRSTPSHNIVKEHTSKYRRNQPNSDLKSQTHLSDGKQQYSSKNIVKEHFSPLLKQIAPQLPNEDRNLKSYHKSKSPKKHSDYQSIGNESGFGKEHKEIGQNDYSKPFISTHSSPTTAAVSILQKYPPILEEANGNTTRVTRQPTTEINLDMHYIPPVTFRVDKSENKEHCWSLQIQKPEDSLGRIQLDTEVDEKTDTDPNDHNPESNVDSKAPGNQLGNCNDLKSDNNVECLPTECKNSEFVSPEKTLEERVSKLEVELCSEAQRRNLLSKYMRIMEKQIERIHQDIETIKNSHFSPIMASTPRNPVKQPKMRKKDQSKIKDSYQESGSEQANAIPWTFKSGTLMETSERKHHMKDQDSIQSNNKNNSILIADTSLKTPDSKKQQINFKSKKKTFAMTPQGERAQKTAMKELPRGISMDGVLRNMTLIIKEKIEEKQSELDSQSTSFSLTSQRSTGHSKNDRTNRNLSFEAETASKIKQCIQEILDKFQSLERRTRRFNFHYFE